MRIDILTLFPDMFHSVLATSILKRASVDLDGRPPLVSYRLTDIRKYTKDRHGKVDQPPYGGGPGMVIQCQPVWDAVHAVEADDPTPATRIHLTPQGRRLDQATVETLSRKPRLLLIAGHYEAIDERVIQKLVPIEELSIGDYVLSGGEIAAMVLIDAVVRLLPGVLGDDLSTDHESFSPGIERRLDYPHYTRPANWNGVEVPPVLLTGNHAAIETWRRQQSLERTRRRRPDLLSDSDEDAPPAPSDCK